MAAEEGNETTAGDIVAHHLRYAEKRRFKGGRSARYEGGRSA